LIHHVDSFKADPDIEEGETIVVFSNVEESDVNLIDLIATKTAIEIAKTANKLKIKNVVLHPSGEPGKPKNATHLLRDVESRLKGVGFRAALIPLDGSSAPKIKAKGPPLSKRISPFCC
jgi:hypothetical protein